MLIQASWELIVGSNSCPQGEGEASRQTDRHVGGVGGRTSRSVEVTPGLARPCRDEIETLHHQQTVAPPTGTIITVDTLILTCISPACHRSDLVLYFILVSQVGLQ